MDVTAAPAQSQPSVSHRVRSIGAKVKVAEARADRKSKRARKHEA